MFLRFYILIPCAARHICKDPGLKSGVFTHTFMENTYYLILSKRISISSRIRRHIQNAISSFIQTLLLVTGSDRISRLDAAASLPGRGLILSCGYIVSYTVTMLSGITTSREFHPAPKNLPLCISYIVILFAWKCKREFLLPYFLALSSFPIFIVRPIRFFATSTEITCTSTISPTLTASSGCLMNLSVIWETCTRPS